MCGVTNFGMQSACVHPAATHRRAMGTAVLQCVCNPKGKPQGKTGFGHDVMPHGGLRATSEPAAFRGPLPPLTSYLFLPPWAGM